MTMNWSSQLHALGLGPGCLPSTVEEFEAILDITPEFSNAHELFHSARYHPEGDHSLRAHMIACFEKWLLNIPCLCNAGHSRYLSFWSLFFHDIGKQATATVKCENLDGSITHSYIKHESVGGDIFRDNYSGFFDSAVIAPLPSVRWTPLGDFMRNSSEDRLIDADAIEYCIRQHMNFWTINKHGKVEGMRLSPMFWLLAEVCLCDKMGFKDDEWSDRLTRFGYDKKEVM